jgi:cyclopropane-fatty-acyl-phospholipid synthase
MMAQKKDIQEIYNLGNDFYFLWLDLKRIYSCAVWYDDTNSLEEAQVNKLERISEFAHISPGMRVLDVGCGWGGALKYYIEKKNIASGTGLTLSENQIEEMKSLGLSKLEPILMDWKDYSPEVKFEAIISMGAFEHFASLNDRRDGKIVKIYQYFFRRCHAWSLPGSYLALQTIIGGVMPLDLNDIKNIRFNLQTTLPNSVVPYLEEIVVALREYYDIEKLVTIGYDYCKTAQEWLKRLTANKTLIIDKFGERLYGRYERYLSSVIRTFKMRYVSLAQMSLRRVDIDLD